MEKHDLLLKFKEDSEKYNKDPESLHKILKWWEETPYFYYIDIIISNPTTLSKHLLIMSGVYAYKYIHMNKINSKETLSIYLDYLESLDIKEFNYSALREIHGFLSNSVKTIPDLKEEDSAGLLLNRATDLEDKLSLRLKALKEMELVCLSIGDHEHSKYSDTYFFCSVDNIELKEAFVNGSNKISFDFLNFVRNRHLDKEYDNQDDYEVFYDGMLEAKQFNELRKLGYSYDESGCYSETVSIYMFIAKLGNENLDYCEIERGYQTIEIWEYNY